MMKAWEVTIRGNGSENMAIIAATTRNRARLDQFFAAKDAGFDIPYIDFHAKRAPQWDSAIVLKDRKVSFSLGFQWGSEKWGCLRSEQS